MVLAGRHSDVIGDDKVLSDSSLMVSYRTLIFPQKIKGPHSYF